MKKHLYYFLILFLLFFSCKDVGKSDFQEIVVDMDSDISLSLSAIADEITAIELELTDESLINPDQIYGILLFENQLFLTQPTKILVFGMDGKYIRSIGSIGQGPGEFRSIGKCAIDEKNKRLIVTDMSSTNIICYDLNGNFLFQSSAIRESGKIMFDLNCINDNIFVLVDEFRLFDAKGTLSQPQIYRLNHDFQITDSMAIRKANYESLMFYMLMASRELIVSTQAGPCIFCPDYFGQKLMLSETAMQDTLYRIEKNNLVPELKLKFRNDGISGGEKIIELANVYRSARYVFSFYRNQAKSSFFNYCYDTKTGTGYNMKDGYTDDIHHIEKRLNIHPLITDTEFFYYWYTHLDPDSLEEPNPTLYIGKLKK